MTDAGRTITLLGRITLGTDGELPDAAPRGRRAELVFAYLVAEHDRVVTHDELADALWPEGLPGAWDAGLRGVLTEVRRYLADGGLDPNAALSTARRGYQLHLPVGVEVDLDQARVALDRARADLAGGAAGPAAASAALASALARRGFLPNHEGDWVDGIRRELEIITARALEVEARAHAAGGDAAAAATAAERLVQAEPFNEAAHQLRIRVLGQAGDRSGAIRAYEHCRVLLVAELGVEPSEETAAALRDATADAPVPPPASTPGTETEPGLSLLVVEDHDFQRRTAVALLRNLGLGEVRAAEGGAEALELLRQTPAPDVILCDIDMPGMDGVEFIRHVAEGELAGAVIIASGLDAKVLHAVQSIGEGYGLQVLGTIEKPITARRLSDLLAGYRPKPGARGPTADGAPPVTAEEVRVALASGLIEFHLRPVVEVATGEVVAATAVPTWPGIPSMRFLPVLEREGLVAALADRALAAACEHLRVCSAAGLEVAVAVDLPRDRLHDIGFADRAATTVGDAGVDRARITFEFDERAYRTAPGPALGVLTRLRVKGFGVSLGGFGTGNLPTEQVRGLPLTDVTLAPALVAAAATDPRQLPGLEDAVGLARDLGVTIVGDGGDTEAAIGVLLAVGCDRAQGAFVAEAMPGGELPGWAASWDPDRLGLGERG